MPLTCVREIGPFQVGEEAFLRSTFDISKGSARRALRGILEGMLVPLATLPVLERDREGAEVEAEGGAVGDGPLGREVAAAAADD